MITQFYAGKFNDFLSLANDYITLPNIKDVKKLTAYGLLCFALFLNERNDECLTSMDKAEKLRKDEKPFPFKADFLFIRSYINNEYEEAAKHYSNIINVRSNELRKVRILYFLILSYVQLGDKENQKKYLNEIIKRDNKTYFGLKAREIMDQTRI